MTADFPSPGDVLGFWKPDGSMGITEFSDKAESVAEHVLYAAVEEAKAILRSVTDRDRARAQATACLRTAIITAAMVEVRAEC